MTGQKIPRKFLNTHPTSEIFSPETSAKIVNVMYVLFATSVFAIERIIVKDKQKSQNWYK